MVKLDPARIFPSKTMGAELPTLIVAAFSTIHETLLACAPFSSVNVMAPFTVKSPRIWITKSSVGSPWASKIKLVPVVVEIVPEDAYTVFPKKVWLVAVVNNPVEARPSPVLNAPLTPKMALYAVVTAESFPNVQGAALVGVQTKPLAVPGGKPVAVLVAPTLPTTTEVPVFEILPPRSPNELAEGGTENRLLPKAGNPTAIAVNPNNILRIFLQLDAPERFVKC
jgi:hypothetical protein